MILMRANPLLVPFEGVGPENQVFNQVFFAVFRIRIRIHRIHMFLGLLDPDPGSGSGSISQKHGSEDPDPDPPPNVMDLEHCFFGP